MGSHLTTSSVRRLAALGSATAVIGFLGGCHSGGPKNTITTPTGPGASTSTAATTSVPATSGPPATEPATSVAKLHSILLSPGDLPSGFAPSPVTDTGGDLLSLQICGHPMADTGGAMAQVQQVLRRSRDQLRLVEQVDGFVSAGAAAGPLAGLRALVQSCPQSGATSVSAFQPPAVGEDVAGTRLAGPSSVVDVAMVRSGPIVTVVILTAARPIEPATLQSVIHAAGTKLAVGTGG